MSIRFDLDPSVTPELRGGICSLWADVANAGGAVGFVPPVTREEIRPELIRHLVVMAEERAHLIVGRDVDGTPQAMAFVHLNPHRLMQHWVWVYAVMVHPSLQGQGTGRALMGAVDSLARRLDGVEGIRLTCRGGTGAAQFYERCGYKEVGRVPGAIRVAADDFRDDITLWRSLA